MSSRMHCGPLRVEERAATAEPAPAAGTRSTAAPVPQQGRPSDRSGPRDDPWGSAPTRRQPSRGLRRILAPL